MASSEWQAPEGRPDRPPGVVPPLGWTSDPSWPAALTIVNDTTHPVSSRTVRVRTARPTIYRPPAMPVATLKAKRLALPQAQI